MYSIGQFALILKVSTRTLRHYDDIGLLKPSYVDESSNYRFYEKDQLPFARHIFQLKEAGLQLEEIKKLIEEDRVENWNEILMYRISKLEEEIELLSKMKSNLKEMIAKGKGRMSQNIGIVHDIELCTLDSIAGISKKVTIKMASIGEVVGELYGEVGKFGLRNKGGHIVIYSSQEFDPENAEMEIYMPVEMRKEVKAPYSYIEAGQYARAVAYTIQEKGEVHAKVLDWIKENGLRNIGYPMERYNMNHGKFEVEVFYRIQR